MNSGHITVFTTGAATIRKPLTVNGAGRKIETLRVRREDLGHFTSSLFVSGKGVSIVGISYPAAAGDDPDRLTINSSSAVPSLVGILQGSQVTITQEGEEPLNGVVLGLSGPCEGNGAVSPFASIVLRDGEGLRLVDLSDIASLTIQDETVRARLEEALQNARASLDEGAVPVTIELQVSSDDAQGELVFNVPAAKVGISYQVHESNDGKYVLLINGHLHNPTPDAWTGDLTLTVGAPNDFRTDVADMVRPKLSKVTVLDEAQGDQQVDRSMGRKSAIRPASARSLAPMGLNLAAAAGAADEACYLQSVEPEAAETMSVSESAGGWFRFDAVEPVNIPGRSSATIVLGKYELADGKSFVFWQAGTSSGSQALSFTNSTQLPLGKGPATIYRRDERGVVLGGRKVINPTRPNSTLLLPYAREERIRFSNHKSESSSLLGRVEVVSGVAILRQLHREVTIYRVENDSSEAFESVVIQHNGSFGKESSFKACVLDFEAMLVDGAAVPLTEPSVTSEATERGARLSFSLAAHTFCFVMLEEEYQPAEEVVLRDDPIGFVHLLQNFVHGSKSLLDAAPLQGYVSARKAAEELQGKVADAENAARTMEQEMKELRELIPTLDGEAKVARQKEVSTLFDNTKSKRKEASDLKAELKAANETALNALRTLVDFTWDAPKETAE